MKVKRLKDLIEQKDPGFGKANTGKDNRALNKDGSFNVKRKGMPWTNSFELYHELIYMSWFKFTGVVVLFYIVLNLIFACLYTWAGIGTLTGITVTNPTELFLENFFFSSQTLTTVGYGRIAPIGTLASSIAAVESMIGLLGFAIATGLLYGRFSRPKTSIKYSDDALIAPYKNGTAFMFRIVNERKAHMIEVEAATTLALNSTDGNGARRFFNLKLELTKINFFPTSWTLVHPIDEESPLWGMTEQELRIANPEFIILIKAFDDTFAQTVYSRSSYKEKEIVWGAKYKSMVELTDRETILHIEQLNDYEKVELPAINLVNT